MMYQVLDKDTIISEIVPHLPLAKRGFKTKSSIVEIINSILYKLKTGCQWHMLPVSSLFSKKILHYKTVFGHYRKWCKLGAWQQLWENLPSFSVVCLLAVTMFGVASLLRQAKNKAVLCVMREHYF